MWIAEIQYFPPYAHFQGQFFLKKFQVCRGITDSTETVVSMY